MRTTFFKIYGGAEWFHYDLPEPGPDSKNICLCRKIIVLKNYSSSLEELKGMSPFWITPREQDVITRRGKCLYKERGVEDWSIFTSPGSGRGGGCRGQVTKKHVLQNSTGGIFRLCSNQLLKRWNGLPLSLALVISCKKLQFRQSMRYTVLHCTCHNARRPFTLKPDSLYWHPIINNLYVRENRNRPQF